MMIAPTLTPRPAFRWWRPSSLSLLVGRQYSTASSRSAPCLAHRDATHPDPDPDSAPQSPYVVNLYARAPLILKSGRGSWVYDSSSPPRKYCDLSAGIAVTALGHSDPEVAGVIADQATKLLHTSNMWWNEPSMKLAERLVELTRASGGLASSANGEGRGLKVFLANSGTEANEMALKTCRAHGKANGSSSKVQILAFKRGFAGRSLGSLSVTPQPKYQAPFAPLLPGIREGELNGYEGIETLIDEDCCGVIVEPIQGEGGIFEAQEEWLRALRQRCNEVGALLIFDEIQCGLGRTGSLWSHCRFSSDTHPDIVTFAKALGNGLPIGGVLMKDKVADTMTPGMHGTTFGANPLCSSAALSVLERIAQPLFLQHVRSVGEHLRDRLERVAQWFPDLIKSKPRGTGLIQGLPLHRDPGKLIKLLRERGVLLLSSGNNTIRFVPSLMVTEQEINHGCDVLESCLALLQEEVR